MLKAWRVLGTADYGREEPQVGYLSDVRTCAPVFTLESWLSLFWFYFLYEFMFRYHFCDIPSLGPVSQTTFHTYCLSLICVHVLQRRLLALHILLLYSFLYPSSDRTKDSWWRLPYKCDGPYCAVFSNLLLLCSLQFLNRLYDACLESKDTKLLNMYNIFNLQKRQCEWIACT